MGLDELPEITTVKELAKFLKVAEITVRRAIADGKLRVVKVGKSVRIEKESVLNWLEKK